MATFDPLTGNAIVLTEHVKRYLITADTINEAAMSLIRIAGQQDAIGQAFDAVHELTTEVSREISQAEERYRSTSHALARYASDLSAAQERANRAIASAGSAQADTATWAGRVSTLEEATQEPGPEQLANKQRLAAAQAKLDEAQVAQGGAANEYNAAVADKDEAGNRAAALIESVVKDSPLNDGAWDNVGALLGDVTGGIDNALGAMINFLDVTVDVIARLLTAVVMILALGPLAEPLSALLITLALEAMVKENGEPTVKRTPSRTPDRPTNDPYASLFLDQRDIDSMGKDLDGDGWPDDAVVRVTGVVGADGVTRWRVQIPSTQVWPPYLDSAPNDLNADLVAKLNPAQRTQLEKAVQSSLEQTEGYTAGAPVMLSGFSLGGITAGNLAADPAFAEKFNVQAVVTGGAPLDDIYIPPNISVVSLEHNSDPVANMGDLLAPHRSEPNRIVVDTDAPSTLPSTWGVGGKKPDMGPMGHGAVDYAVTAGKQITRSTDPAIVRFRRENAEFFGTTDQEAIYNYSVTRG